MADSPEVIEAREKTNDKEYFSKIIEKYPTLIEWANEEIRDDKEIMLKACSIDGGVLEFASDRLKDDKEIILKSVTQAGWTCCYASDRLKDDKDVLLAATKVDGQALYFASQAFPSAVSLLPPPSLPPVVRVVSGEPRAASAFFRIRKAFVYAISMDIAAARSDPFSSIP